jgi:hypothetical protein
MRLVVRPMRLGFLFGVFFLAVLFLTVSVIGIGFGLCALGFINGCG